MTADEASYSSNQVQEMINTGIQSKMTAWSQHFVDEDNNQKFLPNPRPFPQCTNTLTYNDLAKLANILRGSNPSNSMDLTKLTAFLKGNTTITRASWAPKSYIGTAHAGVDD